MFKYGKVEIEALNLGPDEIPAGPCLAVKSIYSNQNLNLNKI